MANLPADLPTNWTQGQIISPNGTEVGLTEQHGYNYLNEQVNAAQEEVNTLSQEVDALSQEVSGAASQTSVDDISEKIGTTTDSGATSSKGTLMGKVNELLKRISAIEENNKFYYFSTTEREVVLDQQYSTQHNSRAGAVLLGKWFAQRTGVIVIQFAAKSASSVEVDRLRFFVYNLKYNCDGYSNSENPLNAGTDASLFDMPAGSSVTPGTPDYNGCALVNININSSSYKTRKYALHVSKGDTLFFVLGNSSSSGDPGYCNHVGIAYADSEESA